MNGEGEINVDYIMWLNKKGDEYVIEKYKIQHPNEILEQLDVFEQNPLSYDFFIFKNVLRIIIFLATTIILIVGLILIRMHMCGM